MKDVAEDLAETTNQEYEQPLLNARFGSEVTDVAEDLDRKAAQVSCESRGVHFSFMKSLQNARVDHPRIAETRVDLEGHEGRGDDCTSSQLQIHHAKGRDIAEDLGSHLEGLELRGAKYRFKSSTPLLQAQLALKRRDIADDLSSHLVEVHHDVTGADRRWKMSTLLQSQLDSKSIHIAGDWSSQLVEGLGVRGAKGRCRSTAWLPSQLASEIRDHAQDLSSYLGGQEVKVTNGRLRRSILLQSQLDSQSREFAEYLSSQWESREARGANCRLSRSTLLPPQLDSTQDWNAYLEGNERRGPNYGLRQRILMPSQLDSELRDGTRDSGSYLEGQEMRGANCRLRRSTLLGPQLDSEIRGIAQDLSSSLEGNEVNRRAKSNTLLQSQIRSNNIGDLAGNLSTHSEDRKAGGDDCRFRSSTLWPSQLDPEIRDVPEEYRPGSRLEGQKARAESDCKFRRTTWLPSELDSDIIRYIADEGLSSCKVSGAHCRLMRGTLLHSRADTCPRTLLREQKMDLLWQEHDDASAQGSRSSAQRQPKGKAKTKQKKQSEESAWGSDERQAFEVVVDAGMDMDIVEMEKGCWHLKVRMPTIIRRRSSLVELCRAFKDSGLKQWLQSHKMECPQLIPF